MLCIAFDYLGKQIKQIRISSFAFFGLFTICYCRKVSLNKLGGKESGAKEDLH